MSNLLNNPLFGIFLSLVFYSFFKYTSKKIRTPLYNPLLLSVISIILFLFIFRIDYQYYKKGGDVISYFLGPIIVCLGYSIYQKRHIIKKYYHVILITTFVGALSSVLLVYGFSVLLNLNETLRATLLPKSVTAPIAIDLSERFNGIKELTVVAVSFTGIVGAIFSPIFMKLLKKKNEIALGIAIGTASHAIGTAKAREIGELTGAIASLSIALTGVMTILIYLFL